MLTDLPGRVVVRTSPGGEVFLDDVSKGQADANGGLAVASVSPGSHILRVTGRGKNDFRQIVTVVAGQATSVDAHLSDLPSTVAAPNVYARVPGNFPSSHPTGSGLSKGEILAELRSGYPSREMVAVEVKKFGISFQPTMSDLNEIRRAGANEALIKVIRAAPVY